MKRITVYMVGFLGLVSCQRELRFPDKPVAPIPLPEKTISSIVITNLTETDYDSLVFRYSTEKIREVHYSKFNDSVTRSYFYDAAGRLSAVEDEKAIYYTNNNMARRISFQYDGAGQLLQTKTDFVNVAGVLSHVIHSNNGGGKQVIFYDTAYTTPAYNLDWANRIIYSTVSNSNYILYDSSLYINTTTTGLLKTMVSVFNYGPDSSVTSINKRIYFNHELAEQGTANVTKDRPAPVFSALRKKLYSNLSNWFEPGSVWQDDHYHLFPLPGGPYKSILYTGVSLTAGAPSPPFVRNYEFANTYNGDQLDQSLVTYTLSGQGTNNYVTVLRFYY